jgi:SPP1 family predicted phage head-tail adaptor
MQPFKYNPNFNSGSFRHRIIIQNYVETENDKADVIKNWSDYKTVWAMIKTIQGREYFSAATTQNENTVRFVIRYTEGIHPNMRIVFKSRIFKIESVINDDELNKTLTIIGKEMV